MRLRQRIGRLAYRTSRGGTVVRWRDLRALAACGALNRRSRARIGLLVARDILRGPPATATVRVGHLSVSFGTTGDLAVDWSTFVEVFGSEVYAASYRDAAVIDVGAHKGYFGARAVASGASFVMSFEPESGNFAALAQASSEAPRWVACRAAIGATRGRATLHRDAWSWSHSLVAVSRPAGDEEVEVVTLDAALAQLPAEAATVVVKVDAEGSECEILSACTRLDRIDELMVEWHAKWASCTDDELVAMVEAGGLRLRERSGEILRFARDGGMPS